MEDIVHEYKCACLGINILRHLTTVDLTSEVATDERDVIVWRLLGLIPSSTDFSIPTLNTNRPSSSRTISKCKYNNSCSLPLPDIILSCSSSPLVRPKASPKECGRHLKHMADQFTHRRSVHKIAAQDEVKPDFFKNCCATFLVTLFTASVKILKFLKR